MATEPTVQETKEAMRTRTTVCEGSLNNPASSERQCRAAHRLHRTHVAWSRSAIGDDPTDCYQCHVFARIVLAAADEEA